VLLDNFPAILEEFQDLECNTKTLRGQARRLLIPCSLELPRGLVNLVLRSENALPVEVASQPCDHILIEHTLNADSKLW
jgi:hypothetical protein